MYYNIEEYKKEQGVVLSKTNAHQVLGDITAENDTFALDQAFYVTQEYCAIRDSRVGGVIVGRRGTGKSAIYYRLQKELKNINKKTCLLSYAPDEEDIVPIRAALKKRLNTYRWVRAAIRQVWKYALLMDICDVVLSNYKIKNSEFYPLLEPCVREWRKDGSDVFHKIVKFINSIEMDGEDEDFLHNLSVACKNKVSIKAVNECLGKINFPIEILVDRMDEGFVSDDYGIGIIAGILYGTVELNTGMKGVRVCVFCRDNIYRHISEIDTDFTRVIEGQEIRLNWNETTLFNLVGERLAKLVFETDESPNVCWNKFVSSQLRGMEGFRECLRHTLYRPRDVLSLLNNSHFEAVRRRLKELDKECVLENARNISANRLSDLIKEYENVAPSLQFLTRCFQGRQARLTYGQGLKICELPDLTDATPVQSRELSIVSMSSDRIKMLYSVGFIGVYHPNQGRYIFCHDGKSMSDKLNSDTKLLVHPCYWRALDLADEGIGREEASAIDDEYSIEIQMINTQERERIIGQLKARLGQIPLGRDGASEFEEWCRDVLQFGLNGHLSNIELHPNKNATFRRDVVGVTEYDQGFGQRVRDDYGVRHLIFEVKNFEDLKLDSYRQIALYLKGEYGRLGFIVCRCADDNLRSGGDLEWFKEMYLEDKKVVIKVPAEVLAKHLGKMRRKSDSDDIANYLIWLLNKYHRIYLVKR